MSTSVHEEQPAPSSAQTMKSLTQAPVASSVPHGYTAPAVQTRPLATTVALLVSTFLSSMDVTVVGTALPRISGQLGGLALYPWVFSIFLLTTTVTVPLWGKLADLFGRRPSFLVGISVFLLASLCCGLAPTMGWLVAARGLQGIGAGAIPALSLTIFGDIFPVEKRARMQGLFSLVWGVSSVVGPAVGGFIVHWWSWRWVFYINLPVGALAMGLFMAAFHEAVERREHQLDLGGAALLSVGVSLFLLGLSQRGPLLLMISLVVLGGFVAVERRAAEPLVPLDLFGDRVLAVASATGFLTGPILFGYVAYVPLYLQGALGVEPLWAGLLMSPMMLAWTTGSFGGGRLILRVGYRPVVRAGTASITVGNGMLWLALRHLPSPAAWSLFVGGTVAVGLGMGGTLASFIISVQERVAWQRRGVATAIIQFLRSIGATIGVALLGIVLAAGLDRRLHAVPNAPAAGDLLDPAHLAQLSPAALQPTRAALAASVTSLFVITTVLGLGCWVITFWFPAVRPSGRVEPIAVE